MSSAKLLSDAVLFAFLNLFCIYTEHCSSRIHSASTPQNIPSISTDSSPYLFIHSMMNQCSTRRNRAVCRVALLMAAKKNENQPDTNLKGHFIGRKSLKLMTGLNFLSYHYQTSL